MSRLWIQKLSWHLKYAMHSKYMVRTREIYTIWYIKCDFLKSIKKNVEWCDLATHVR